MLRVTEGTRRLELLVEIADVVAVGLFGASVGRTGVLCGDRAQAELGLLVGGNDSLRRAAA